VHFPVALRRREAEQILTVQLVGDRPECRPEILPVADLGVAAAGLLRDDRQAGIGQIRGDHRLQPAAPQTRVHRLAASTAHADGVDHHVFLARAVDDLGLTDHALLETERHRVFAIAQHEDDGARVALSFSLERIQRVVARAPERRRRIRGDRGRERPPKFFEIVRELRADDDLMAERADAHDIVFLQTPEQLLGSRAQQLEVALHAARDVEEHDQANRLRRVVEERNRLRLAFVAQLEIVLGERGDEPAVAVGDGDERADDVARPTEDGRLLRRGAGRERNRNARRVHEMANHGTVFLITRQALLQSYHGRGIIVPFPSEDRR